MSSENPYGSSCASNSHSEHQQRSATSATGSPGTNPMPAAPMCVEEHQSKVAQGIGKTAENEHDDRVYRLEVWQQRFTAALVGTAILTGVIATWQGCEMKNQNNIMLRQMEQTDSTIKLSQLAQRSEIALDSYSIENVESDKSPVVKVKLKNIGHLTATIELYGIAWLNRRRTDETLQEWRETLKEMHASSVKSNDQHAMLRDVFVTPGDTFSIEEKDWPDLRNYNPHSPLNISPSATIQYEKEIHEFVVYAFYKDAIRGSRFSQFILRYDPVRKTFLPEERGSIEE